MIVGRDDDDDDDDEHELDQANVHHHEDDYHDSWLMVLGVRTDLWNNSFTLEVCKMQII